MSVQQIFPIGYKFYKEFDGEKFQGEVKKYEVVEDVDAGEDIGLYHAVYQDGDREELEEAELKELEAVIGEKEAASIKTSFSITSNKTSKAKAAANSTKAKKNAKTPKNSVAASAAAAVKKTNRNKAKRSGPKRSKKSPTGKATTKVAQPKAGHKYEVGYKFVKDFDGEMFEGMVESCDIDEEGTFYHVKYEDGDEEDLEEQSLAELKPAVVVAVKPKNKKKNPSKTPANSKPKTKRVEEQSYPERRTAFERLVRDIEQSTGPTAFQLVKEIDVTGGVLMDKAKGAQKRKYDEIEPVLFNPNAGDVAFACFALIANQRIQSFTVDVDLLVTDYHMDDIQTFIKENCALREFALEGEDEEKREILLELWKKSNINHLFEHLLDNIKGNNGDIDTLCLEREFVIGHSDTDEPIILILRPEDVSRICSALKTNVTITHFTVDVDLLDDGDHSLKWIHYFIKMRTGLGVESPLQSLNALGENTEKKAFMWHAARKRFSLLSEEQMQQVATAEIEARFSDPTIFNRTSCYFGTADETRHLFRVANRTTMGITNRLSYDRDDKWYTIEILRQLSKGISPLSHRNFYFGLSCLDDGEISEALKVYLTSEHSAKAQIKIHFDSGFKDHESHCLDAILCPLSQTTAEDFEGLVLIFNSSICSRKDILSVILDQGNHRIRRIGSSNNPSLNRLEMLALCWLFEGELKEETEAEDAIVDDEEPFDITHKILDEKGKLIPHPLHTRFFDALEANSTLCENYCEEDHFFSQTEYYVQRNILIYEKKEPGQDHWADLETWVSAAARVLEKANTEHRGYCPDYEKLQEEDTVSLLYFLIQKNPGALQHFCIDML